MVNRAILTVDVRPSSIENRIYRVEFNGKKCKPAILLYCFHTAGVLHIFMLYNLLGPGISFYRKSKIIVKRKPNYEIGWFHNWPMIISHRLCLPLYKRWFSVITINQMMFFIQLIHYKVYFNSLKIEVNLKLKLYHCSPNTHTMQFSLRIV